VTFFVIPSSKTLREDIPAGKCHHEEYTPLRVRVRKIGQGVIEKIAHQSAVVLVDCCNGTQVGVQIAGHQVAV
jgi:hypothetical protein